MAFGVGAGVNLLGAALLVRLASRTRLRSWPPAAQGAAAAGVSAAGALWALLRIVGIGLLDFVSGLVG